MCDDQYKQWGNAANAACSVAKWGPQIDDVETRLRNELEREIERVGYFAEVTH